MQIYDIADLCVACGRPTVPGEQICASCQAEANSIEQFRRDRPKPKTAPGKRLLKQLIWNRKSVRLK